MDSQSNDPTKVPKQNLFEVCGDGNDLQPIYDSPNLSSDQRIGNESEDFTVTFSTDDGPETYSPGSVSEFQQFTIGSTWQLKLNALGGVVSVER